MRGSEPNTRVPSTAFAPSLPAALGAAGSPALTPARPLKLGLQGFPPPRHRSFCSTEALDSQRPSATSLPRSSQGSRSREGRTPCGKGGASGQGGLKAPRGLGLQLGGGGSQELPGGWESLTWREREVTAAAAGTPPCAGLACTSGDSRYRAQPGRRAPGLCQRPACQGLPFSCPAPSSSAKTFGQCLLANIPKSPLPAL